MSRKIKIEKYYRVRARDIVDVMHDKGFFDKDVTRAAMRHLQEYIAFVLKSTAEMEVEASRLLKSIKDK